MPARLEDVYTAAGVLHFGARNVIASSNLGAPRCKWNERIYGGKLYWESAKTALPLKREIKMSDTRIQ